MLTTEQIEVVPFFHKMAFTIVAQVGEENPQAVLATTILAYSLSSVLTGLVFFLMGQCRLGVLIGFFPRHILIGCIGGVGFFLVVTGLEVSARLEGNLDYNLGTLQKLVSSDTVPLWTIPLALALSLFLVKKWIKHSLTDACFFISIFIIVYIVVAAVPDLKLETLRSSGWIFEAPPAGIPWYHFYSLYGSFYMFAIEEVSANCSRFRLCRLEGCCFNDTRYVCADIVRQPPASTRLSC